MLTKYLRLHLMKIIIPCQENWIISGIWTSISQNTKVSKIRHCSRRKLPVRDCQSVHTWTLLKSLFMTSDFFSPDTVEILTYKIWNFFQSRKSEDDVLRDVLSQIAEFLKADDTERARKLRQTGTSGNEMAQIFEQLANSEVHFI